MTDKLTLEIVTPEKLVFSDVVEEVTVPGGEGQFGILVGHIPLLSTVVPGELNHTKNNRKTYYAVGSGYCEMTGRKVTVLVESAERADMIDWKEAEEERDRLQTELSALNFADPSCDKKQEALALAVARVKVFNKVKSM